MLPTLQNTLRPLSRAPRLATSTLSVAQNAPARYASKTATAQSSTTGRRDPFADIIDVLNEEPAKVPTGPPSAANNARITRDQHLATLASGRESDFLTPYHYSHKFGTRPPRSVNRKTLGPDAPASRYLDPFRQLSLNPLAECQNAALLSEFVTPMGKIIGRKETGLTWHSQRKLGKAIRRAKMMGVMPTLYAKEDESAYNPTSYGPRRPYFQRLSPNRR